MYVRQFRIYVQRLMRWGLLAGVVGFLLMPVEAGAVRIKDLANVKGVRSNQLLGYGLVVGLQGTGDGKGTQFTIQSVANMLGRMGIRVSADQMRTKNVAAVIVTAELPPFASVGDRLDVSVSSLGDAKSLQGGTLLFAPLKAPDQRVYAVAQGPLTLGGFGASSDGASAQVGHLNAGRIASGAIVERELKTDFYKKDRLTVTLKTADFTTASRLATAINLAVGNEVAKTLDAATIDIMIPGNYKNRAADFVAAIERIDVTPDRKARVVINERTGTVVIGEEVRLGTAAISHGKISIEVRRNNEVVQPLPFSAGRTATNTNTEIKISEESGKISVLPGGVSIGELAKALNAMGVTPRELASIFQALKGAGSLDADIIIQ